MRDRDDDKRRKRLTNAKKWAEEQEKGRGSSCVKLPEGIEPYKLVAGVQSLDFMLYKAGPLNRNADEGFPHFELTYGIHRIPSGGNNTEWVCCLWDCFKKKCPVCQWMNEHGRDQPELVKALRVSTRHLWLVNDKPGDKKNRLKILDTNHYNRGGGFGEMMADAINAKERYADFAELEGGLTVQLTGKEMAWPGGKYMGVTRIDFEPRDYDYPESMLENAPCLDDCLIEPDPKKLLAMLDGGEPVRSGRDRDDKDERRPTAVRASRNGDEDEDDDAPVRGKKKAEPTAEDLGLEEGDMVIYDDDLECEIVKISGDGTSLTLKDEDGKTYKAVAPSAVEVPARKGKGKAADEDDEDDDLPAPKARGKRADPDDEDEEDELEDEDEDDEDEPVRGKGRKQPVDDLDDEDEDEDEAPAKKKRARR